MYSACTRRPTVAAAEGAPRRPMRSAAEDPCAAGARSDQEHNGRPTCSTGSMEGDFDRGYAPFTEFMKRHGGSRSAGQISRRRGCTIPLFVKTHEIAPDPALARERIGKQLNLGVSGIVFVGVESAEEVRTGLAAMRFKSKGGTSIGRRRRRAGVLGNEREANTKDKADVWPLNPNGELVNFTIVESKEGLKHVREIAAVKGIGVLFPGAGTLRGVFTDTTGGQRKLDTDAWEAAIQQVLAACKEFKVPCGYPATATDIEMRMKQGFSVFVINWGDAGFKAVDIGVKRRRTGRG